MMSRKPKNIFFCVYLACTLFLIWNKSSAQNNCPFIWPLDGGECSDCAPGGWTNILTADIVDGVSWFVCDLDNYGQSPTGGNSVIRYRTNNNNVTISIMIWVVRFTKMQAP